MAGRGVQRLTAGSGKAAPPGRHADGGGHDLYVSPSGGRSWVFRRRRDGKRRAPGLGAFPAITLDRARQLVIEARETGWAGGDPLAAKRRAAVPIFGEAAETFIGSMEAGWRNETHRQQWRKALAGYARPIARTRIDDVATGGSSNA